ncbi:BTAD domain-containing putative transcriptional regulator [Pseudonocardia sp. MH-G8]|uniref:AfsR/SARP family transcriptional regulator n=1 Tax=Pseudonocardia sp. MH-G8 TaxID=1854588 RepID=UPI000BA167F1|nr:BTAD domain-containing putative transcriptional regulator [Pseudonocardia sp. MH-G8]OZM77783.1 AfsR family transcriptional regulator [Pseudonocardia sp. MH-G8]
MRFGVLGPVAVWTADGRPVRVPERKVRVLLADLLVNEGRPVAVERLVEHLWGAQEPGNPLNTLQTKVSQLRRTLERAEPGGRRLVVRQPPGYLLRLEEGALDVHRLRTLTAQARAAADPAVRAALLADALALWRGPALADVDAEPFAVVAARRLEEERLAAEEDRAEARLRLGRAELGPLVAELGDLVARHPLRERLRATQMRALYRAGRQGEALAAFAELRGGLVAELGLEPGPEITALQRAVLAQDPALSEPPQQGPGRAGPAPAAQARAAHVGAPHVPGPQAAARTGPATPDTRPPGSTPPGATPPDSTPPDPAPGQGTAALRGVPVPLTELVGRDTAVRQVQERLAAARLVTLTGPGGVGKTRLAAAVARASPEADDVCLVELAGLDRQVCPEAHCPAGDRVVEVVAAALGVRAAAAAGPADLVARIGEAVAGSGLLLLLDNCEQVVEPVAALAERLLQAAPDLRILATSREPLGVPGEVLWEVPPLALPAATDLAAARASSAVQLFAERAAASAPGFVLDDATAPAVATICRRLDGLPLALELAASRVRALGVHEVLVRLDNRFALLTNGPRGAPDRQRTLRAVIDWSWELLTDAERIVLRRLAVHPEGCDLAGAEAVCAGGGVGADEVLDLLARLVDRSLVVAQSGAQPGSGAGPRFRLLETVAAYGLERMAEAGELELVRQRHSHHHLALVEHAEPELRGPDQQRWLEQLDAEAANLRTAVDHLAQQADGAAPALRLVQALCWYWFLRGRTAEATRSLRAALAVPGAAPAAARTQAAAWLAALRVLDGEPPDEAALDLSELTDPPARARTQWFLGHALTTVADPRAVPLTSAALATAEAVGDRWGIAAALADRVSQVTAQGHLPDARAQAERAAALFREVGDRWGQVQATFALGALAEYVGEYARTAAQHQAGLRMAEELGLWAEVSYQLSWLGRAALLQRRFAEAETLHRRAVAMAVAHGFAPGRIYALTGLALGARRTGDLDTAEEHLRTVLAWHRGTAAEPGTTLIRAELGFVAELRGDAHTAVRLQLEGHAVARRTGDPRALALALEGLAGAVALAGAPRHAARLLGAAAAARQGVGAPLPPAERGDVDRITTAATRALGEPEFTDEFAKGAEEAPDELVNAAATAVRAPPHATSGTLVG